MNGTAPEGAWSKPHIWMQRGGNWITLLRLLRLAVIVINEITCLRLLLLTCEDTTNDAPNMH